MREGRSLPELAVELERQANAARDFRTPANIVSMIPQNGHVELQVGQVGHFGLMPHGHDQLGVDLGIPAKYYDRMLATDRKLLAHNVNTWLAQSTDQRLVRTLDGDVRGWLSSKYRVIDNLVIAQSVLPLIIEKKSDMRVISCEVTDKRLYIKVVNERLTVNVKKGEAVQSGLVITNSEVGAGALKVEMLVYILACLNGAIMPAAGLKRYHIGRHADDLDSAVEIFSDETRAADDKALMLKVRDATNALLDEVAFKETAKLLTVTAKNKIERDPLEALDSAIEVLNISGKHRSGILTELIRGADLSQWGLSNAVTAYAQRQELSYEEATELERTGGNIITLTEKDWKKIAS